jgi:hypothetical protein
MDETQIATFKMLAFLAALPDSQKQKLWDACHIAKPDNPLQTYFSPVEALVRGDFKEIFDNIFEGL